MKTKVIKEFRFDKAAYIVGDGNGERVRLQINYKENNFKIDKNGSDIARDLEEEMVDIAKDLLKRKHAINFADR